MKITSLNGQCERFCNLVKTGQFTGREDLSFTQDRANKEILENLHKVKEQDGCVFIVGNGGSASIASHICTDFINVGSIRSTVLHESCSVTCFANDYGYENVFSMQLHKIAKPKDMLIAISSSGQSQNIVNAAMVMRGVGGKIVTLSGFSAQNPLRQLGDVNYWVNSSDYGMVEIAHMFLLHHLSDQIAAGRMALHDKVLVSSV
ncbi:MAG: SIS domain-containing protein [Gammaproteobacteria bacterium]|nr:SIS domain-containing protein [Gammaproteobacteria bacterium]MDH5801338.1 SIS domain-containing protein [Gammaproteobacteria bacterium]